MDRLLPIHLVTLGKNHTGKNRKESVGGDTLLKEKRGNITQF